MPAATETPPATTNPALPDYYQPVTVLLNEIRLRQRLVNSTVAWLNAFTVFKTILRNRGLSDNPNEQRAFLQTLSDLDSTGRALLAQMGADAPEILNQADISPDNFNACLEFLESEKLALAWNPDPETLSKLNSFFGQ